MFFNQYLFQNRVLLYLCIHFEWHYINEGGLNLCATNGCRLFFSAREKQLPVIPTLYLFMIPLFLHLQTHLGGRSQGSGQSLVLGFELSSAIHHVALESAFGGECHNLWQIRQDPRVQSQAIQDLGRIRARSPHRSAR